MRGIKKKHAIFVFVVIFSFAMVHIVQAVTAQPGTDQDPLVTKSYVDEKVKELVDDKVERLVNDKVEELVNSRIQEIKDSLVSTELPTQTPGKGDSTQSQTGTPSSGEVQALKKSINELTKALIVYEGRISKLEEQKNSGFEVVKIEQGQKMFLGSGAELVLRGGKATAIEGEFGGLSDVTGSIDLKTGDSVALNHLIISARDDYRGIKAETEVWIIVRGSYKIH